MKNQDCNCQKSTSHSKHNGTINDFYSLRNCCPALQLTIPDDLIENHRKFVSAPLDDANHCSIPFLAFRNGYLAEFTRPIHRFALDSIKLRSNLTNQYKSDFRETWILGADELSRYKKSRNYLSRLGELHFAQWLEGQQWEITNLEMYGGNFDVEGTQNDVGATSFEVKFLSRREVVFELINDSFANPRTHSLGVYSPIDYLLFRLHEAAHQLQKANTKKIAVAIIEDYDLSYKIPLKENWINWKQPVFLKKDSEIQDFLNARYAENPNLDSDLTASISTLSEIWILRYNDNFELHREHKILISQAQCTGSGLET